MDSRTFEFSGLPERLDRYLARSNPDLSRAALQRLIAAGAVRVNGAPATEKNRQLVPGDRIELSYEEPRPRPTSRTDLRIVYQDNDLLVLDKPAGLVVHTTPTVADKDSVVGALLAAGMPISGVGEDRFRPGIVHRLDADTSGLLVVAKTQAAYDYLKNLFQSRALLKEYLALVHGAIPIQGEFSEPIGRRTGRGKFETGIGRPAYTTYRTERYLTDGVDKYTLVRVQLHTGRTHQIRVHFAAAGHPVAGDRLYGGRFRSADANRFPRQFLHAYRLQFRLLSGKEREFTSELPAELQEILSSLNPA